MTTIEYLMKSGRWNANCIILRRRLLIMKWTGAVAVMLLLVCGILFSKCGGKADHIDTVATPITQVIAQMNIADEYYNRKVQLKTRFQLYLH